MHIAIAGSHWAEGGTEISANGVEDGFAESEAARAVPDEGREEIAFSQRQPGGNAQGFLAAAEKNSAMDFAHAV
jgi:hypothetical protein